MRGYQSDSGAYELEQELRSQAKHTLRKLVVSLNHNIEVYTQSSISTSPPRTALTSYTRGRRLSQMVDEELEKGFTDDVRSMQWIEKCREYFRMHMRLKVQVHRQLLYSHMLAARVDHSTTHAQHSIHTLAI